MALLTSPFGGNNVQAATDPPQGFFHIGIQRFYLFNAAIAAQPLPKSVPASSQLVCGFGGSVFNPNGWKCFLQV
jgi:hypothetical protein